MKIVVELDEFWMHDEAELSTALSKYVTNQVISEIWKKIKSKVDEDIQVKTAKMVEKLMYQKASSLIDEALKTQTIKTMVYENSRNVEKLVSLEEYIGIKFKKDSGWGSPDKKIEELAKQFADELKKRYDLLFASQIVSKLNENGLLKEDVHKMLMESTK